MKNEEASRINTAAQEYAMEATPLTREIWKEAYRDGRRAEYYHQITVISEKDTEIERLKKIMKDLHMGSCRCRECEIRWTQFVKKHNL